MILIDTKTQEIINKAMTSALDKILAENDTEYSLRLFKELILSITMYNIPMKDALILAENIKAI